MHIIDSPLSVFCFCISLQLHSRPSRQRDVRLVIKILALACLLLIRELVFGVDRVPLPMGAFAPCPSVGSRRQSYREQKSCPVTARDRRGQHRLRTSLRGSACMRDSLSAIVSPTDIEELAQVFPPAEVIRVEVFPSARCRHLTVPAYMGLRASAHFGLVVEFQ